MCILMVLLMLCFSALVLWVHAGPRSLNAFAPYIETALAPKGSDYSVTIGNTGLLWDTWAKPLAIHIHDVTVHDSKGGLIASFPDIEISVYGFELLFGKVQLKSLVLLHPDVVLLQGDDGTLSLGFNSGQGSADSLSTALALMTADAGGNPITHLKSFLIRHASLAVKNSRAGVFLRSQDASLEVRRVHGVAKATLSMPVTYDNSNAQIDGDFTLDRHTRTMTGEVVYTDIPSAVVSAMIPAQDWIAGVHMPLSGWAKISSDFDGTIRQFDFTADAGQGSIHFPSEFKDPLHLEDIKVSGSLSDHFNTLTLQQGILSFKHFKALLNGTVRRSNQDYGLTGTAKLSGTAQLADATRYWPLSLSPQTRSWVAGHLSGGTIPNARVTLNFQPGDFTLKNPPDKSIDADIAVKDTTITYLPTHPAVTNVNGTVHFTGNTMDVRIASAKYMSGSQVQSAHLWMPDLAADDMRLFIDMDIKAPAVDVVTFLSLPDLDKARKLGLTQEITGNVSGNVKIDFIAFSEDDKKPHAHPIHFAVEGNLSNVSQRGFLGNRDIADATAKISLNNKGVKLTGRARVNRIPMAIELSSAFAAGNETKYAIRCDVPVLRLPDFGLPSLSFMSGIMGVDATFVSSDTAHTAMAKLDLTDTDIQLPEYGFAKKKGQQAILDLATQELPSGNTRISSFDLEGNGVRASGEAEIDKADNDFKTLNVDTLHLGDDDLSALYYERMPNGVRLMATGRSFDVSPYVSRPQTHNANFAYDIDITTDRMVLGENRALQDVSVKAQCAAQCRAADIAAKLPDGTPFRYSIHDGKLLSTCSNAGALAKVMGVFDGMSGGDMTLAGSYESGMLSGTMDIKSYTLKGAPVLTRILTIASLTGVFDTVAGNGISFAHLTAPFLYRNNVITLQDAKTHGPALGITAGGTIDLHAGALDLKGALVPSYTLNSLIGNVPLIGNMLMGGPGKGLIAISYSIHGDMKDPSIRINPLSALTPGFLRNIFTIFDKPAPNLDKILKAEKNKKAQGNEGDAPDKPAAEPVAAPAAPAPAAQGPQLPPIDAITQ
jgi:hypothetical protein